MSDGLSEALKRAQKVIISSAGKIQHRGGYTIAPSGTLVLTGTPVTTPPDDLTSDPWDDEDLGSFIKDLNEAMKPKVCECGAVKAKTSHAFWCPIYVEYGK